MSRRSDRLAGATNLGVVVVGLSGGVAGVGLLWLAEQLESSAWRSVVNNLGGLVVATALIAVAWELVGKRSFADEILAKARLSTDVSRAGLQRVTDLYLEEVEWRDLIEGASKIDIVVSYANTWRNAHRQSLAKVAGRSGARIRVFLPDADDELTLRILSDRFSMSQEELAGKIREAVQGFAALHKEGGAELQIFMQRGDRVFTCYRFDGRAVITLYTHTKERQSSVPTLVVGPGVLWDFVYEETKAIGGQSRQVFPETGGADRGSS